MLPEKRFSRRSWLALGVGVGFSIAACALLLWPAGPSPARAGPGGHIAITWGVGGVLTDDGRLWQFRPESREWVTVDQSFALDGERRKVLPLPVPVRQIADMEGFGFLVTKSGSAWLYNLETDSWENIGAPGR